MKRQRRAWSKQFQHKGGFQPNREVIRQYQDSARGIGLDEREIDDKAAALLRKSGEERIERRTPPGRVEAHRRQAELEAKLPDGCDMRYRGPGPQTEEQSSFIYRNSRKTQFVLVYIDLRNKIESRSIVYSSQELLIMAWELDRVFWVEETHIPT